MGFRPPLRPSVGWGQRMATATALAAIAQLVVGLHGRGLDVIGDPLDHPRIECLRIMGKRRSGHMSSSHGRS
jgi:hypothetical protein